MSISYRDFSNGDLCRPPKKHRNIGRRNRSFSHNHRSGIAETWEYDWEAKEKGKNHHRHFCGAMKHADGLNEWFAIVEFPFTPYWSDKHQCYHVGRDKRMEPAEALKFLGYSRARDRLRNSNSQ